MPPRLSDKHVRKMGKGDERKHASKRKKGDDYIHFMFLLASLARSNGHLKMETMLEIQRFRRYWPYQVPQSTLSSQSIVEPDQFQPSF